MNRRLLLLVLSVSASLISLAQDLQVKGNLQDKTSGKPLSKITIVLKQSTDTTKTNSTLSDSTGSFEFNNLNKGRYILQVSSVGYDGLRRNIDLNSGSVDLGKIGITNLVKEMQGVTITTHIAPAQQKGDTVEFNASQFKVNPDANAEDLAKKVPGITVENGQVKAQGENVKRVTLDGRELFGDDATAALRNLPAEIVDKIQVFDRLSDQAQLTGFNDGNTSKEINIITKANMRNGQYGRVYSGYGTDDRYQGGGNATILKENKRISLVGLFNNINQQNFSQQDLLGVSSGGGGMRGGMGGGGMRGGGGPGGGGFGGGGFGGFGGGSNFFVGQQSGINKTNAIGVNFSNYYSRKLQVSGSYFFNNTANSTSQQRNTQYFLSSIPSYDQSSLGSSQNYNHRVNARVEWRPDSSNQLIFSPSVSFQKNNSSSESTTSTYFTPGQLSTESINTSSNDRTGNNMNANLLYAHSFPKRGRSISLNLNTQFNKRNGDSYVDVENRKYQAGTRIDSLERRFTDQFNQTLNLNANLSYTEPITTNSQIQLSYSPSYSTSKADQEAFNYTPIDQKYTVFNPNLSNKFNNYTKGQNGGISYRYGTRDNQMNFGVSYQQTELSSDQTFPRNLSVNKTFYNFLPNAMVRLKLSQRSNVRLFYRTNTNQPSITQLQDVFDIGNRPYISIGNPDLKQQYSQMVNGNYTYTNTGKGILFVANAFAQKVNDYISNATFVAVSKDSSLGQGQTLFRGEQLTKPINLDGYESFRSFMTFAFPLRFIKSNFNVNGGYMYSKSPGILNNVVNESRTSTYNFGSVISSNVSQYVDFTISYNGNYNKVKNKIDPKLDNNYYTQTASAQMNLLTKSGWFLQQDINNQYYNYITNNLKQDYWLWNMAVGYKFLKNRKGELKLSVFDLLKQNQSISRQVTENYIQDVNNKVLQQYFMLTFTYNLRNFGKGTVSTNNNMRSPDDHGDRPRMFPNQGGFPRRENF